MAGKAHCMLTAQDASSGAVLTSATVNVYTPGTVTPVPLTLFDKNNGVLSNPLTADPVTGLIDFYMTVAQEVDLVISKASYTTRTFSNVPVLDDSSNELSALLTTTGDMVYASSANTPARIGIGATGALMQTVGGLPGWLAPSATTGSLLTSLASGAPSWLTTITATGNIFASAPPIV